MIHSSLRKVCFGFIAAMFCSCGPVKFVSTWKAPDAAPIAIRGQKVAAFVMTLQKAARFPAEDALARELSKRGVQGIAGYTVVPPDLGWDKEKALPLLKKEGVEGAVMMRPVGRDTKLYQSPGAWYTASYYPSFWGYWGYGWSTMYAPGRVSSETVVSVETLVYSIKEDRLLWAGLSETTDPKNVNSFVTDLVTVAGKELRKAGLVQK